MVKEDISKTKGRGRPGRVEKKSLYANRCCVALETFKIPGFQ